MLSKKWVSMMVAVSMVAVVAGCSTGESTAPVESAKASEAPKGPVKLSILTSDNNQPVPGGNTMDDPTLKFLAEKTNTDLTITFLPGAQADDQKRIKFASGEIPDVVQDYGINGDLFTNNQLIPLDDLLEKYGQNLKKVIPKESWEGVTRNGKIYAIPEAPLGNSPVNRVLFVRKDWMDKVGIKEAPKTTEEFLNMLRAFRDKDPNGNGKKDELPFSAREKFEWLDGVLGMFGTSVFGGTLENGEIVPRNTSPQMKQALSFVAQMMDEKLIDSEFMTNKRNIWEQKIQSNLVGVWTHAPNLAWDWQERLNKSLPGVGAEVIAISVPKAPGVKEAGFGKLPYNKTFQVTKAAKDPAAAVKFFDWLATQEGQEFVNFGVPGISFTKDNGKINYNKQKDTDDKTILWRSLNFNIVGWNEELEKVKLGDQAVAKLKQAYEVGSKEGLTNVLLGAPPFKSTLPEIGEYGTAGTMFVETASRIAMKDKPVDYFDEYVKNWRTRGGNDLIKQATDWYNANGKK
jgi:putative aldouronate transport system substrate-binding protein